MTDKRRYSDRREYTIASVIKRRKKTKLLAVEYMGGRCVRCGYNKYLEVLEFHHRDPAQKEFNLGLGGLTRSWERVKAEIEKCDLLCANCHREQHVKERKSAKKINDRITSAYIPQSEIYPALVNA